MEGLRVQYGCGMSAPAGWLNFDISPTLRLQRLPVLGVLGRKVGPRFPESVRYGDIAIGLPLPDQSCSAVYCSHVLEHLPRQECHQALVNTLKLLRPGGLFRLVMPDLRVLVDRYVNSNDSAAAHRFVLSTNMAYEKRPVGWVEKLRKYMSHNWHRWLWDYPSIEQELKTVGFDQIRRASFNDSSDDAFRAVEDESRWEESLGVECRRPLIAQ